VLGQTLCYIPRHEPHPPAATSDLPRALSPDRVLHTPKDLLVFEYDG
jgi:hypothetical protein